MESISRLLSEDSPAPFIVLDKQWHLVYLNKDAREIFLSKYESLIGRTLEEIYPRQFSYILSPETIRGLLGGKENNIIRYVNHFRKWFKTSAYESDLGIFIRLEDVTRDMLSNRFLRLNRFSVHNAKDMVFWFKPSGHIIYANKASSNSLGFEMRELASMMVADIDPSFTSSKWAVFVEDVKMNNSMVYESSFRACDRSIIPVEVTCNYLVYYGEEYLIAFARDITERKKAEEELRRSHIDLEKKVDERTEELMLEKMQAELYLDLMGHDISNMHQIAMGQLELAHEIMAEKGRLDGDEKELIEIPLQTLERSAGLIDNVRNLQKLRSGEFKEETIDLNDLLSGIVNEYKSLVPSHAIKFVGNGPCPVIANKLLHDVFSNIVGNAIKHSNGNNIYINIELENVSESGKNYYKVSVEDNGPGIPDDLKDKIFNRLQQGKTKARGLGLGLYLVKSLMDSYHGKVWVEDRIQGDHTKGARFVVMLPAVEK
jgi:PAS domain S-box-containing protein